MKGLILAATLACSSLSLVILPLAQPLAAIAQTKAFANQSELEAKYQQIKKGMTVAQVKKLLGDPQWSVQEKAGQKQLVWNYFVKPEQRIFVIRFDKGSVVSKGGQAG
jgi:outer membrane protein assembly factor BamE (lipoprotein component of BamABCDE complex)